MSTDTATTTQERKETRNPRQLDALSFCKIWNSCKTRREVVDKINGLGFNLSYSAIMNRHKSYTREDRPGGPIHLKDMDSAPRGRRIDTEAINAELAKMEQEQEQE